MNVLDLASRLKLGCSSFVKLHVYVFVDVTSNDHKLKMFNEPRIMYMNVFSILSFSLSLSLSLEMCVSYRVYCVLVFILEKRKFVQSDIWTHFVCMCVCQCVMLESMQMSSISECTAREILNEKNNIDTGNIE